MSTHPSGRVAVTGRFQPFHHDHLELALHALSSGRHLLVGITNPDVRSLRPQPSSRHRHLASANPFSYLERAQMIAGSLASAGIGADRFGIVPFPLDAPQVWSAYIPAGTLQLVRAYSDWERDKARQLQSGGYPVELQGGDSASRISGTAIRAAMASGDPWQHWVPAGSRRVLEALGADELRRRCAAAPAAVAS
jgi:nicotinamide-nucleotide adenylyltransferase